MEWICNILKEASKNQRNMVRGWKTKKHLTEYFCSRKDNNHGRKMSILSLLGDERLVIIIPELALNAGWSDIAFKIKRFIKCYSQQSIAEPPRITDENYPYAKALRESKSVNGSQTFSENQLPLQSKEILLSRS